MLQIEIFRMVNCLKKRSTGITEKTFCKDARFF